MAPFYADYVKHTSNIIELVAVAIIAFGVLQASWHVLMLLFASRSEAEKSKIAIRLKLGRWLSIALEFQLAADIMRTAVDPAWNELARLGALAVLRTFLNFFLEREIRNADVDIHSSKHG